MNWQDIRHKAHLYKTARIHEHSRYYTRTNRGFVRIVASYTALNRPDSPLEGLFDVEHPELGVVSIHFEHLTDFCL